MAAAASPVVLPDPPVRPPRIMEIDVILTENQERLRRKNDAELLEGAVADGLVRDSFAEAMGDYAEYYQRLEVDGKLDESLSWSDIVKMSRYLGGHRLSCEAETEELRESGAFPPLEVVNKTIAAVAAELEEAPLLTKDQLLDLRRDKFDLEHEFEKLKTAYLEECARITQEWRELHGCSYDPIPEEIARKVKNAMLFFRAMYMHDINFATANDPRPPLRKSDEISEGEVGNRAKDLWKEMDKETKSHWKEEFRKWKSIRFPAVQNVVGLQMPQEGAPF